MSKKSQVGLKLRFKIAILMTKGGKRNFHKRKNTIGIFFVFQKLVHVYKYIFIRTLVVAIIIIIII